MIRHSSYIYRNMFYVGESRRIVAAGGFVESGRVNGSLALSRALGDFEFKMNATLGPEDQIVTGQDINRGSFVLLLPYRIVFLNADSWHLQFWISSLSCRCGPQDH